MSPKLVMVPLRLLRRGRLSAFLSGDELAEKVLRGGLWVSLALGVDKVLGLARSVVLARLLFPEDFGLMGVVMVALVGLEVFTNATTGIEMAIVQHRRVDERLLNTAWTISIIRGIALSFLLFFSAPLFAAFFHRGELTPLLKAASVVFFISGLKNVGFVLLQREMDFRRRTLLRVWTNGMGTLVAVILAFILRNVWALVIAYIIESLIGTVGSYFVHPFRPHLAFDPICARQLFWFAKFIFIEGIMVYLTTQGDDVVVGKALGMEALGFYTLAYMVVNVFKSFGKISWEVAFPAYSKVQEDKGELGAYYSKALKGALFLALPLAGLLFGFAPEIVEVVYGAKWLPAVLPIRVFCFLGGFMAIGAVIGPLFPGIGRPDILLKIKLWDFSVMAGLIFPSVKYLGVTGAALAVTVAYLVNVGLHIHFLGQVLPGIRRGILKGISHPLTSTLGMLLAIGMTKRFWSDFHSIGALLVMLLLGMGIYLTCYYVLGHGMSPKMIKGV